MNNESRTRMAIYLVFVVIISVLLTGYTTPAAKSKVQQPSVGKARVYVYRLGRRDGTPLRFKVFVDGNFLAELDNSNYTTFQVSPGGVAIAASGFGLGHRIEIDPGPWTLLPACAGVTWSPAYLSRVLNQTQLAEFANCQSALRSFSEELRPALRAGHTDGKVVQLCNLRTSVGPLGPEYDGLALKFCYEKVLIAFDPLRVQINVIADQSYYVRWAIAPRGNTFTLVDAATGAKEIRGLKPAKVK